MGIHRGENRTCEVVPGMLYKHYRYVLQTAYLTHKLLQNILLRRPRHSSQWAGTSALLINIGFVVHLNCSGHPAAPVSPTGSPGDLASSARFCQQGNLSPLPQSPASPSSHSGLCTHDGKKEFLWTRILMSRVCAYVLS